jgi:hypothetical protein
MHDIFIGGGNHHVANHIVQFCELHLVRGFDGAIVTDFDKALEVLTIRLRLWCRKHGAKFPPHRLTRNCLNRKYKTHYPELATTWKAAHCKLLIKWVGAVAKKVYLPAVPDGNLLKANALSLAKFVDTLDCAGPWLSDDEVVKAQGAGKLWLQSYKTLALHALAANQRLWYIIPKHHYIYHHILDLTNKLNPRCLMTWLDEDFMGKISRLARRCSRRTVSLRVLQRYLLFISNRWKVRRREGRFS